MIKSNAVVIAVAVIAVSQEEEDNESARSNIGQQKPKENTNMEHLEGRKLIVKNISQLDIERNTYQKNARPKSKKNNTSS